MSNVLNNTKLTGTLTLSECKDGFWLYDKTRGMNLAMKAKSSTDAFVGALEYYQERLMEVESSLKALQSNVDWFVSQVHTCEDSNEGY